MSKPFTADELRKRWGRFYKRRQKLDADVVPDALKPLIPYAEVWGLSDDYERENLVDAASEETKNDVYVLFKGTALYGTVVDWLADTAGTPTGRSEERNAIGCLFLSYESIKATRNSP